MKPGANLRAMKFSKTRWIVGSLVTGLCLAPVVRLAAQGDGSLKNSEIEKVESRFAVETVMVDNQALREKLAAAEATVASLQKNLAATNAEAEVFRRKAGEINLRLEALGTDKIDDRLKKLLNNLTVLEDERKQLREGLLVLSESAVRYQKASTTTDMEARAELEAAMRTASKALGVAPPNAVAASAVPSTLTDGMIISVKEDLALVVANLGSSQGVKVGMPFQVLRGEEQIGTVRVVDVREKIAGALIQNLSDKEKIKVGDRLKADAQR